MSKIIDTRSRSARIRVLSAGLRWIAFMVFALCCVAGTAVFPETETKIVQLKTSASRELIHRGEAFHLKIEITVVEDWHIQAAKPDLDFIIPTSVSIEDDGEIELINASFPKPKKKNFPFFEIPVKVFSGSFTIKADLRFNAGAKIGVKAVLGHLEYQACNMSVCLPPAKARFSIPIMLAK